MVDYTRITWLKPPHYRHTTWLQMLQYTSGELFINYFRAVPVKFRPSCVKYLIYYAYIIYTVLSLGLRKTVLFTSPVIIMFM